MIKFFALKFPPLLILVMFASLMWLTTFLFVESPFLLPYKVVVSISLFITAIIILLASTYHFKKAKTTVNPIRPDSASSLVTTGIYKYTRNPMYVSFLLLLISWGLYLSTLQTFIFILPFIVFINYLQIKPEEKALLQIFGQTYSDYQQRVRRWF